MENINYVTTVITTQLLMKKKPNGNGSVNGLILVRSGLNAMVVYFLME